MESFRGIRELACYIMEDWKLLLILAFIYAFYFYYTTKYDFFKKKGIKYLQPKILFGHWETRFYSKKTYFDLQYDIYNEFKGHPCGGIFDGSQPLLYIIDPDLIKAVTIRDFEHFMDRSSNHPREPTYIQRCLLNLKGSQWKAVRSILTPSFSSARLKNMLSLFQSRCDQLVMYLKQHDNSDVEMKHITANYTLEIIATSAFGIQSDALTDENSYFVKFAKTFNFMPKGKRFCAILLLMLMPKMTKYINVSTLFTESIDMLRAILKKTRAERRLLGIKRNDFLQLIIDAAESEKSDNSKHQILDEDTIDGQLILFLIAGYETSSSLLAFGIHTLAINTELQTKLRAHIEEKMNGEEVCTYEILSEMTYLEAFMLEILRRYPTLAMVDRICTKPYVLPGTTVRINPGDRVGIPIYGIHMDPDIYPDPEIIRPERFMGEEKKGRASHLYLAFGAGPRNCIGAKFGMYSTKMAMVALLRNFKFSVCAKTENPIKLDKNTDILKAKNGLWVHLDKI